MGVEGAEGPGNRPKEPEEQAAVAAGAGLWRGMEVGVGRAEHRQARTGPRLGRECQCRRDGGGQGSETGSTH